MKDTGRVELDHKRDVLISEAQRVIDMHNSGTNGDQLKAQATKAMQNIRSFRVQLAAHRGTEFIETRFEWTHVFDSLVEQLMQILKESQNPR